MESCTTKRESPMPHLRREGLCVGPVSADHTAGVGRVRGTVVILSNGNYCVAARDQLSL